MPRASELAQRPDFRLGPLHVSPAKRRLAGRGGDVQIEPLTMEALLLLAGEPGLVVTRERLFEACWGGGIAGDDSLNRVIAKLRRALAEVAPGAIEIENIPRTGYCLRPSDGGVAQAAGSKPSDWSRRALVGGGLAAATALGGSLLWANRSTEDPRVTALRERGSILLREERPDQYRQTVEVLRRLVALAPDDPDAWAMLALAWRNLVEFGPSSETALAVSSTQAAAHRALRLAPRHGDALAALAKLWPVFGDWLATERRLRQVLAVAPDNLIAFSALGTLLQAVGRVRESAGYSTRSALRDPLSPIYHHRRMFGLYCTGRVAEADRTIDRALRLWPRHATLWNSRMLLFALTDRPRAALAMLDDRDNLPPLPPPALAGWKQWLDALVSRASPEVPTAIAATIGRLPRNPAAAVHGICFANILGDLDSAFVMADAYLLRRGPGVGALRNSIDQPLLADQRWQMTMMLFIPATAPMRADQRFLALCRDMGMADYWRASGSTPDFLRGLA